MEAVIGLLLMLLGVSHALPEFTKVPVDQIGVSGGVISFVCQATGNPKPRVSWMKKGKKISFQRSEIIEFDEGAGSVLRIEPLRAPRDDGIYECVAENTEGNVSVSARLSVIQEDQLPPGFPTIDIGLQLRVVERNRTATLLCSASGNPDPEITWYKKFLPIDPSASNGRIKQLPSGALQIDNSEEADEGKYECVVSNVKGVRYAFVANVYVRVRRIPPRFSIPPTDQEVMLGGSVNLTCHAVGSPLPYVQWKMGLEELTKEDEIPIGHNVLQLTNVLESANYTCVAMSSVDVIEATARITVKALPKPPTSLIVTETTATSVTLTWDSGNPEPVSYYVIQYRAKSSNNEFQEVDGVSTTRYSVGGLRPNSEYEFRVLAAKTFGRGHPSDPVEVHTGEQAPSSPPQHIRLRMLSARTMLVQWEPPEEPNGQIRGYRIYYSSDLTAPLSGWQKQITDDTIMTTISGLTPDITYGLRVQGFTSVGDGPLSDMVQVKTQQGVPGQPYKFQVGAVSDTSIELTWEPAFETDGVKHYELQYIGLSSGTEMKETFAPTNSYVVEDLRPNTEYHFYLAAISNQGIKGFASSILQKTTPVSSVVLVSECLSQGEIKVSCSSEGGDSPQYSWTLDGHTLTDTQLLSGNSETNNITLKSDVSGQLVCSVRNHVSGISTCGYMFIVCTLSNGMHISQSVRVSSNSQCIEPTSASTTIQDFFAETLTKVGRMLDWTTWPAFTPHVHQ